ncbi:PilZ domain-containing protein [Rhizobium sp. SG2393]|uniref:PilZ domain-containing protein n=1 Tax=Rhizobium sp. SG2393 TaxID=3276279 RepID=UPI003672AC13
MKKSENEAAVYARVRSEFYERKYERFALSRAGTLMSVQPGLSQVSVRSCQLMEISRGGASFTVHTTTGLPTHYYLSIVGFTRRIGCAEIFRRDNRLSVAFIKPIDELLLRKILRADFFTGVAPEPKAKARPKTLPGMGRIDAADLF